MTPQRCRCSSAAVLAMLAGVSVASAPRNASAESHKRCSAREIGGPASEGSPALPASLLDAEEALVAADEKLQRARDAVVSAEAEAKRVRMGLSGQTAADGVTLQNDAQSLLEEALRADREALADYECVRNRLMAARTWRYGFVGGGHIALDAHGLGKYGPQLQWIWHPYQLFLRQESITTIRFSYVSQSEQPREKWVELIQRLGIPFGSLGTMELGLGAGYRVGGDSEPVNRLAITGDVGLGFRGGQWLRCSDSTFLSEARLFMQPWIPLDGGPATFFFGAEFGLGAATGRIGQTRDLKAGSELVQPCEVKPCN